MKKRLLGIALLLASSPGFAKDLGVHGKIYHVNDVDFRLAAMSEVARVDNDKMIDQWKQNVENKLKNMPFFIKKAPSDELVLYKPVLETLVERDITVPVVNDDGSIHYEYLARAGERLNVFETQHTEEKFYFFNPENPKQLEIAKELFDRRVFLKHLVTPVATGGNMLENSKLFQGKLKYAYQDVVLLFGVTREQTLVYHKLGEKNIRVVEFPEELTLEMFDEAIK